MIPRALPRFLALSFSCALLAACAAPPPAPPDGPLAAGSSKYGAPLPAFPSSWDGVAEAAPAPDPHPLPKRPPGPRQGACEDAWGHQKSSQDPPCEPCKATNVGDAPPQGGLILHFDSLFMAGHDWFDLDAQGNAFYGYDPDSPARAQPVRAKKKLQKADVDAAMAEIAASHVCELISEVYPEPDAMIETVRVCSGPLKCQTSMFFNEWEKGPGQRAIAAIDKLVSLTRKP